MDEVDCHTFVIVAVKSFAAVDGILSRPYRKYPPRQLTSPGNRLALLLQDMSDAGDPREFARETQSWEAIRFSRTVNPSAHLHHETYRRHEVNFLTPAAVGLLDE
jgi:hypothetical protein